MKNPIIDELTKLKLISKSNFVILSNKTRDKKIKVIKDLKTKIIFLEKFIRDTKHYENDRNMNEKNLIKYISKCKNDDKRRYQQFKNILKQKKILDFGCEFGGFLKNITNSKKLFGLEVNKNCIKFLKKNIKKINVIDNLEKNKTKFDVITMFHVLEHIPYQIKTLKVLKSKLNSKGKIIIEVPHAEDFLILQEELKEFKNFTFWSEHLILHTYKSLKSILLKSGFKNINIQYYQRYNFSNHLGWFLKRKPGGHNFYKETVSDELNSSYCENLKKLGQTDTLIAVAE